MRFHVDAEAIFAGSAATGRTVEAIRTEVAALHNQLLAMQSSWTGGASAAFTDVLSTWSATATQVNAALDHIQLALRSAAANYADTEAATMAMFR